MIQSYETDVFMDAIGMKVWEKRHQYAAYKLSECKSKRILDMGCNTGKLIQRLSRSTEFHQIDGIDLNGSVVENEARLTARPEQIQQQYSCMRDVQLSVTLYQGSILDKIQELKRQEYDAITLIEVIEHLQVEDIYLLEQNVFAYLRPNTVILTTPNADFNIYFKMQEKAQLFRDDDHKFEWTQNEFNSWALNISSRYGYRIQEITGVGEHKTEGTKNGYCSQIAVFQRDECFNEDVSMLYRDLKEGSAQLIAKFYYPFETKEEQLQKEVIKFIRYSLYNSEQVKWIEDGEYINYISLSQLMTNFQLANNSAFQIECEYLTSFIQTLPEFLFHEDVQNIQNSIITINHDALLQLEQDNCDDDNHEIQGQDDKQQYNLNDQCQEGGDTHFKKSISIIEEENFITIDLSSSVCPHQGINSHINFTQNYFNQTIDY